MLKNQFKHINIECGKGWYPLLQAPMKFIQKWNEEHSMEDQIEIMQIKEKFGTLRFYVNHCPEELSTLIDEAEDESYCVCEKCGTHQDVGLKQTGWLKTICKACLVKSLKRGEFVKWYSNDEGKDYNVFADGHIEEIPHN